VTVSRDPIAWLIFLTIAFVLGWLLTGCTAPVCPTLATRCEGSTVELCGSDGQWQTVADCAEVARTSGGQWACGETREDGEEINACLPVAP
jgi:hypothetical protein